MKIIPYVKQVLNLCLKLKVGSVDLEELLAAAQVPGPQGSIAFPRKGSCDDHRWPGMSVSPAAASELDLGQTPTRLGARVGKCDSLSVCDLFPWKRETFKIFLKLLHSLKALSLCRFCQLLLHHQVVGDRSLRVA